MARMLPPTVQDHVIADFLQVGIKRFRTLPSETSGPAERWQRLRLVHFHGPSSSVSHVGIALHTTTVTLE